MNDLQRLRILILDDDDPPGAMQAVKAVLRAVLESDQYYGVDEANTEDKATTLLLRNVSLDLVLIDIRLGAGRLEWAGTRFFVEHWRRLLGQNTKVMLYSGKDLAIPAYEWFRRTDGPFVFFAKAGELDPGMEFTERVVDLLRDRVRVRLRQARLSDSDREELPGVVTIGGDSYLVEAMLRPWLYRKRGERPMDKRTAWKLLAPMVDGVRAFSYWCKGQAFTWSDGEGLHGLAPLASYHCAKPTGSLDPLMHQPDVRPAKYGEAARVATSDLENLAMWLTEAGRGKLSEFIEASRQAYHPEKSRALKTALMFRLSDLKRAFADAFANEHITLQTRSDGLERLWMDFEYYAPPYFELDSAGEPAVVAAARRLAASVAKKRRGVDERQAELIFSVDRPLVGKVGSESPDVWLALCHNGPACEGNDSIRSWFVGHNLSRAANALRRCASWYVLSGRARELETWHAPVGPDNSTRADMDAMWSRFNSGGTWRILHIWKIGLPLLNECFEES